jgi:hypothetical protein
MNCLTCKYYHRKTDQCRINPPIYKEKSMYHHSSGRSGGWYEKYDSAVFPKVEPNWWCGKFKEKEEEEKPSVQNVENIKV